MKGFDGRSDTYPDGRYQWHSLQSVIENAVANYALIWAHVCHRGERLENEGRAEEVVGKDCSGGKLLGVD